MKFGTDISVVERRRGLSQGNGGSAPEPHPTQTFRPEILRSLRAHQRLAAMVAAAVFVLVMGYALTRTASYKAESLIYVEPLATKVLSDGTAGVYDPARYDTYLQQQVQTVLRNDILAAAIDSLPTGTWKQTGESEDSAVTRLQDALKVQRVLTSYQISIDLTTDNAENAAAIVNAVANAYIDQGRKDSQSRANPKVQLLTEERQRIQTELEQDKAEQAGLSASIGVANPAGEAGNPYDVQLAGVRTQLATAREAHDIAAAQLSSVSSPIGLSSPGLAAAADEVIAGDAGLSSMKSSISARRALLSSQMAGLTPTNPIYKQDQNEITDLDRALDKMTLQLRAKAEVRLQDKLRLDLRRTGDVEARLNAQLAQQTAAATSAAPKLQRATELAADMQRLSARYASVDDAIRGVQLEVSGPGPANLALAASVPAHPEANKRRLLILLALPLALFAGITAAVFARRRDKHVYIGDDVASVMGFAPIGIIPARYEVSTAQLQNHTLRLAAGIESAYRKGSARTFLFTAVSETTEIRSCVLTLRKTLRGLGFKVIAIDVAQLLRAEAEATNVSGNNREEVATFPNLQKIDGRASIAAANIERMKLDHDLILVCAAPLLESAITEYAARTVDAVMLVAECGVTQRDELSQAATLLQRLHVSGVGVILQGLHGQPEERSFAPAILHREYEMREAEPQPAASRKVTVPSVIEREIQAEERVFVAEEIAEPVAVKPVRAEAQTSTERERSYEVPKAIVPFSMYTDESALAESEPQSNWVKRLFHLQEQTPVQFLPDDNEPIQARTAAASAEVEMNAPVPKPTGPLPLFIPDVPNTTDVVAVAQPEKIMFKESAAVVIKRENETAPQQYEVPVAPLQAMTPAKVAISDVLDAPFAAQDEWGWMSGKTFAMAPVPSVASLSVDSSPAIQVPQPSAPARFSQSSAAASTICMAAESSQLVSAEASVLHSSALSRIETIASIDEDALLWPALAKAAARAIPNKNAPARAEDGLTARREESQRLKELLEQQQAMAAMEARPILSTSSQVRHKHHPGAAVMSRRWHMLSRFDQGQHNLPSDESLDFAAAAGD